MLDISLLSPGMKAKIVDQWGPRDGHDGGGIMDQLLGTVVTVNRILGDHFIWIEEDCGTYHFGGASHWSWTSSMLDYIIYDCHDFEPAGAEELLSMLYEAVDPA